MDWKEYKAEHEKARFDPDFPKRVLEKAASVQQCRKEQPAMKHTKHFTRMGLIAAILVLMIAVTAVAAFIQSSHDAARQDLGIDGNVPIQEYEEYTDGPSQNSLTLVSALRSGEEMRIYLEVSPIEYAYGDSTLEVSTMEYEVYARVGHSDDGQWTKLISYDEETKTALFRVEIRDFGRPLDNISDVKLYMDCYKDSKLDATYGPVMVPVPEARRLTADFEIPFTCSVGDGTFTSVDVSVSNIRVAYTFSPYSAWEGAVPLDGGNAAAEAIHEYSDTRYASAEAFLHDARLEYADGTSVAICDMNTIMPWNFWYGEEGDLKLEQQNDSCIYYLADTLDLTAVTGITIAGVTYPLMTAE